MTQKQELKERLNRLSDKGFIKYLIETQWCMRELVELSIDNDWSEEQIQEELNFLKENKIGDLLD